MTSSYLPVPYGIDKARRILANSRWYLAMYGHQCEYYRIKYTKQLRHSEGVFRELAIISLVNSSLQSIPFSQLPEDIILQLRQDGTHGDGLRSYEDAQAIYQAIPSAVRGDIDSVYDVIDSPDFHLAHDIPYSQGGSNSADNVSYNTAERNLATGADQPSGIDKYIAELEVQAEGMAFDSHLGEVAANTTAFAAGSLTMCAAGKAAEGIGYALSGDRASASEAIQDIPGTVVNNIPRAAAVGAGIAAADMTSNLAEPILGEIASELLGDILCGGVVALPSLVQAATTNNEEERSQHLGNAAFNASCGLAAAAFPPLAVPIGLFWLGSKVAGAFGKTQARKYTSHA